MRLRDAEAALAGQLLDAAAVDSTLDKALAGARPLAGNASKVKLARNTARRALTGAG